MGYTNYWTFKTTKPSTSKAVETQYQLALRQCQRIIRAYNAACKNENPKHFGRLSGFSAHTKVNQYGGIKFNGTGDMSHEDFTLREHFSENEGFNFCKTARKPYDIVVVACLVTLKHYLGDLVDVSSDGDASEWIDGLELAQRVLKIKGLKNPLKNN